MKKYLFAVSVIGLLGSAVVLAQDVDLSDLPSDIRSQVEEAGKQAEAKVNPVERYVEQAKELEANFVATANKFFEEYPYLKGNRTAKKIKAAILKYPKKVNSHLKSLTKGAVKQAGKVQGDFGRMEALYKALTQQTFPNACKTFKGEKVTGYVRAMLTQKSVYAFYKDDNTHVRPIYSFIGQDDVGQVGTGKEVLLSKYRFSKSPITAVIGNDGTGKKAVVCIAEL